MLICTRVSRCYTRGIILSGSSCEVLCLNRGRDDNVCVCQVALPKNAGNCVIRACAGAARDDQIAGSVHLHDLESGEEKWGVTGVGPGTGKPRGLGGWERRFEATRSTRLSQNGCVGSRGKRNT